MQAGEEQASRGDAWHNSHSSIHGNCVSPTTRTGGPFIFSSGNGRDRGTEGFWVVRRGLKGLHHQWSLQMAAHTQTSRYLGLSGSFNTQRFSNETASDVATKQCQIGLFK